MHGVFMRRVLLLVVVLYVLYGLKRTHIRWQRIVAAYSDYVPAAQESARIAIKNPFLFKNVSVQRIPAFHEGHLRSEKAINTDPIDILQGASLPESPVPRALLEFTACPLAANKYTGHIRLPNLLYNISMSPASAVMQDHREFWNPTILALPYWAKNQYVIVNMAVAGLSQAYRQNVLCEANICHPRSQKPGAPREKTCTEDDLRVLGPNGGLRCVTSSTEVDVPPTPAERCEGPEQKLADIPGFHDPRLFYTARGEPILMVVSQSRYACIGLWVLDLRVVYPSLGETFASSPRRLGPGPLMSYPTLTELTRNPPFTRKSYEKNWVIFSPSPSISYVQYELNSTTRSFAQLIGGGLATQNMTDPLEQPCLNEATQEETEINFQNTTATWHQATPSLKLILCLKSNSTCIEEGPEEVFFAAIHRKHVNGYGLPVRYDRYLVVWSAAAPFSMLAISQHPFLFANEAHFGWSPEEIEKDAPEKLERRNQSGHFTYTTTIAYAWGRDESDIREKGRGYLDDEVILSVGVDDKAGFYGKVNVLEMLQCLRICPGRFRDLGNSFL